MNKDELENVKESYYSIFLAFKVASDALNSIDENIAVARNILYDRINEYIPREEYGVFNTTVVIYQTDDYDYIIAYEAFLRDLHKLPMDSYVNARDIKELIKGEFIKFFDSISLDYKLVNIKSLV